VKVVICHVSCRESAELILAAQKKNMQIAIELCPHYLWFDAGKNHWRTDINPVFYKCFNNLRSAADREYLVRLLKMDNPLIFIGSDNAPHTIQEKEEKGLGGLPSNQEMVAVICTLANKHKIPEKRVADLLSWNAGKFLGINIPKTLRECKLERRPDGMMYNGNTVMNPWIGSKLLFPI
jgi:dihydroorotase-like cyclic amidohydrolase